MTWPSPFHSVLSVLNLLFSLSFYLTGTHLRAAFNMILSFQLFCRTLAALNFVRASHSSPQTKDQNSFISRSIRSQAFNTTTAENKTTVVKSTSTTASNRSSVPIDTVQYVRLGLADTSAPVHTCATDGSTITVQDCSCSTKKVAAQAINDAITMVQAVQGVWYDEANLSILQLFMGGSEENGVCQDEETVSTIDSEFLKQRRMYTLNEDQKYWHI